MYFCLLNFCYFFCIFVKIFWLPFVAAQTHVHLYNCTHTQTSIGNRLLSVWSSLITLLFYICTLLAMLLLLWLRSNILVHARTITSVCILSSKRSSDDRSHSSKPDKWHTSLVTGEYLRTYKHTCIKAYVRAGNRPNSEPPIAQRQGNHH